MLTRSLFLAAVVSAAVIAGAPSPTRADEQLCVLLLPDDAVELLVNRCGACREVTLQRVRDGGGIPSVRSLMLRRRSLSDAFPRPRPHSDRWRTELPTAAWPRHFRGIDASLNPGRAVSSFPARQNRLDRQFLWRHPRHGLSAVYHRREQHVGE